MTWRRWGLLVYVSPLLAIGLALASWWHAINMDPVVVTPSPRLPSPNAYDDYTRAGAMVVNPGMLWDAAWGPGVTPARARQLLAPNLPALVLVRRTLGQPFHERPARTLTRSSWNSHRVNLMNVMALAARVRENRGDWPGAMVSAMDVLQFLAETERGSSVRGAGGEQPRVRAWKLVDHLGAGDARAAARRLAAIAAGHTPFTAMLVESKYEGLALRAYALRLPGWRFNRGISHPNPYGDEAAWHLFLRQVTLNERQMMASYTRYMDECAAWATKSYDAAVRPPSPPGDVINQWEGMVDLGILRLQHVNGRAQDGLLAIALALRAYRVEYGGYPAAIADLCPGYLPALPKDPFDPKGFRYRRQGSAYVLYSIGPDQRDDGGRSIGGEVMRNGRGDIRAGKDVAAEVLPAYL